MKNIVVVLLLLFFPTFLFSQTIEGKVVDEKGVALIGANVTNTTSRSSTSTDLDGNFKLKANQGDNLKVTMIGFATKMVKASSNMNIVLVEEANTMQEVVVIGYGTRKKVDNTTSISSIKSDDITRTKVLNASQAIQGKAAGVQVIASDSPGATPTIVVRGLGTALGGRKPLFIIDGMPADNINNINSNDITSYEILKDASALAIYGNRAANGVVILATKKGKGNKMNVELESFVGFRQTLKNVKMAGSNKYSYYSNAALQSTTFSQDQPVNTDWYKEITRTGSYSQNNVSVSGASESIKYFFSAGYYDEKAILKGLDYSRFTFRNNNDYKISKKINLSQNFSVGYTKSKPKPFSAFTTAYKQSPIVPVYFQNGQYGVSYVGTDGFAANSGSSFNNVGNPVADLDFFNEQQKDILLQGGLKLDIDLFKGLKFTSQFNGDYDTWKMYNYADIKGVYFAANPTATSLPADKFDNTLTKESTNNWNWNLSNYFTYNTILNSIHDIELTAGIEASSRNNFEKSSIQLKNVNPSEDYWALNDVEYASNVNSYKNYVGNEKRLNSYFGRFQYKLMNKYLVTGTIRRDGSSQFAKDNQWGTFPSFGLGWIVSNEKFLKNSKYINVLKVRGGWGKLGNQDVALNVQSFASGLNYSLGGSIPASGSTINSQIDPTLGWEITEESSVGIDFELLTNKLKGSFDVYDKRTTNLILNTIPYNSAGFDVKTPAHIGEVSNKGYELSLRWEDKVNDKLSYWIGGNFSTNKNRLESIKDRNLSSLVGGNLGNGQDTKILNKTSVGEALGSFYLFEYAGLDSNGQMLYYKADGTTALQGGLDATKDKKYFGSILPTSNYGVSIGVNYRNFDLSIDGYGTMGAKVYNGKKAQRLKGENVEETLATDFWTTNNTTSTTPAPFNQVPVASTFYLESGDYFRINNITLGYKVPIKSNTISAARIYVNAINPFITQKFSGYTPELNGDGDPYGTQGVELNAYPALRSFVFGVNLKF